MGPHAGGSAQGHGARLGILVPVGGVGKGQRHLGVDHEHATAWHADDEVGPLLAAAIVGG